MKALLELCKRRGFLFPSAELYGGLRGAYDYGPLGVELKRNILNTWYRDHVYARHDVVGLDTSLLNPAPVFRASGHLQHFTDDLVDCLLSRERFRPDKAPPVRLDTVTSQLADQRVLPLVSPDKPTAKHWETLIRTKFAPGAKVHRQGKHVLLYPLEVVDQETNSPDGANQVSSGYPQGAIYLAAADSHNPPVRIPYHGYVEPHTNSPFLTPPRAFNLMFKTFVDPLDPIDQIIQATVGQCQAQGTTDLADIRRTVDQALAGSTVYLRPETAQGVFMNYHHVQRSTGWQPPFGVAQVGKAFRNELRVEHAVFRTLEFEQLELEYFVPPTQSSAWFNYWRNHRLEWWKNYARQPDHFRMRDYASHELAHYASGCTDIEYRFPWGWDELEGVAHRGNYDLRQHAAALPGTKQPTSDLGSGDSNHLIWPHCIESSTGLNRAFLALLLDAMDTIPLDSASGASRTVLRLHPTLAPCKVAVLPLVSKPDLFPACHRLLGDLARQRIPTRFESQSLKIGKRYYRHDEIGTPWCVTVDYQTLDDNTVTLRERDTMQQTRVRIEDISMVIQDRLDPTPFTHPASPSAVG